LAVRRGSATIVIKYEVDILPGIFTEAYANMARPDLPLTAAICDPQLIGIDFVNPRGQAALGQLQAPDLARFMLEDAVEAGLVDPDQVTVEQEAEHRSQLGLLMFADPQLAVRVAMHGTCMQSVPGEVEADDASRLSAKAEAAYRTAQHIVKVMRAVEQGNLPSTNIALYGDPVGDDAYRVGLLGTAGPSIITRFANRPPAFFPMDGMVPPLPDSPLRTALLEKADNLFGHLLPNDVRTSGIRTAERLVDHFERPGLYHDQQYARLGGYPLLYLAAA
jgi:hypothetical protein